MRFNEDTLAKETTANYLRDHLGWDSVFAYNNETFGKEGTFGRKDETEVVLTRYLAHNDQILEHDPRAEGRIGGRRKKHDPMKRREILECVI